METPEIQIAGAETKIWLKTISSLLFKMENNKQGGLAPNSLKIELISYTHPNKTGQYSNNIVLRYLKTFLR